MSKSLKLAVSLTHPTIANNIFSSTLLDLYLGIMRIGATPERIGDILSQKLGNLLIQGR